MQQRSTHRQCFNGWYFVPPTPAGVLGVRSLIAWALIVVVSIKYLMFVMRGDRTITPAISLMSAVEGLKIATRATAFRDAPAQGVVEPGFQVEIRG